MKRILVLKILLISILFQATDMAGQPMSFTLQEAQGYAVENSYLVKNSHYDLEIALKKLKETLAIGFPQLDASLDYNYYPQIPTSLVPDFIFGSGDYIAVQFGRPHNVTAGVVLNQLIFDGRYFIGLEYAKLYTAMSEENLVKSQQEIKASVAQTYYRILVNEEALGVLDSTITVLQKTRYEIGEMFKAGFSEETDYDQITLTLKATENSRNDLAAQTRVTYNLLKFQMGMDIDDDITLTQTLDDIIKEVNFEALINQTFVLDNNVDYRMIHMQEAMKTLSLRNEKAAYWPSINGSIVLQTNAQSEVFSFFSRDQAWYPMTLAGATLNVPVFSSGARKARVDQARLELEQVRNTKVQVSEQLQVEMERARINFITALENYNNEEENVALSRKIYRKTLVKYNEGVATSVELTQQHNQFFETESKYFQNMLVLLSAKIELDKVLGNL